ncbi:MAG: hypothetical protein AAB263_22505 [Planctomycetota bacterium]
MATFTIAAKKAGGGSRSFQIEARSLADAEAQVRALGWEPTPQEIDPVRSAGPGAAELLDHPAPFLFLGAACLIVGPFLPVLQAVHVSANQMLVSKMFAMCSIIGGVLAMVFFFINTCRLLYRIGAILLLMHLIDLVWTHSKLDEVSRFFGGVFDGPTRDLMPSMDIGLGFGWVVLLAGPILLFVAGWKAAHSGYD